MTERSDISNCIVVHPPKKQWCNIAALIFLAAWMLIEQTSRAETATGITPKQIVENADKIRFPDKGFQVDVKITTTRSGHYPGLLNLLRSRISKA